jgi:hypothetical protein
MKWTRVAVVLFTLATLIGSSAALARSGDGGHDIASAPELPLGQAVQGGGGPLGCGTSDDRYYMEFWRLTLTRADHVRLDYGSTDGHLVNIYLLDPAVTDYTLNQSGTLVDRATETKDELTYIAPKSGRFTVLVTNSRGRCTAMAYILTAYVQHFTAVQVSGPPTVAKGSRLTYRGRVVGANAGQVIVYGARPKGGWTKVAVVTVASSGAFAYSTRASKVGTFRRKFSFLGDAQHLPSSSVKTVRVV